MGRLRWADLASRIGSRDLGRAGAMTGRNGFS